ncbi:hypothetical protein M0811_04165 [Anaeramoeba ignava]|uniref:Uncharacterized protein n=1 Tax=Anaeramoeba ignava TaxID=1746090 RepID=A0A9Q0LVX0_ANAIG|nr:hypothetical protein M0811_04165 [Anaeramoeba ignava]
MNTKKGEEEEKDESSFFGDTYYKFIHLVAEPFVYGVAIGFGRSFAKAVFQKWVSPILQPNKNEYEKKKK